MIVVSLVEIFHALMAVDNPAIRKNLFVAGGGVFSLALAVKRTIDMDTGEN